MQSVLGLHVKTVDVVEPAIPCFRDDRQRPPVTRRIRLAVIEAPLNDRIANDSDAVRVGDHHGAFEKAGLFHPSRAGHFTVAVQRPPAGEDRIAHRIFSARKHGGHSRANRPLANLQLSFAGNERSVPDGYAGNIGDGVERPGCAVKRDAEIAGARHGRQIVLP